MECVIDFWNVGVDFCDLDCNYCFCLRFPRDFLPKSLIADSGVSLVVSQPAIKTNNLKTPKRLRLSCEASQQKQPEKIGGLDQSQAVEGFSVATADFSLNRITKPSDLKEQKSNKSGDVQEQNSRRCSNCDREYSYEDLASFVGHLQLGNCHRSSTFVRARDKSIICLSKYNTIAAEIDFQLAGDKFSVECGAGNHSCYVLRKADQIRLRKQYFAAEEVLIANNEKIRKVGARLYYSEESSAIGSKWFRCPECSQVAQKLQGINESHIDIYKRGFRLKCSCCDQYFRYHNEFSRHMEHVHPSESKLKKKVVVMACCPQALRVMDASSMMAIDENMY